MSHRRSHPLKWLVMVLSLVTIVAGPTLAFAQDAPVNLNCPEGYVAGGTPVAAEPAAEDGEPITSLTREEFQTQLVEDLGFTEAATPGGTFIDSYTADIQTVHPFLAEEQASLNVVGLIYDTLVGGDLRSGQIVPTGLADSWEIAPDNRTYTFHLNKDAKWHDGTDVTANDAQVVARDRRRHLRGRRQGTGLHLPLRHPDSVDTA
jgi:ABC-type transport system substrate-binding protein